MSEDFVCPFKDSTPPLSGVYSIHITSLTISPLLHQFSSRLFIFFLSLYSPVSSWVFPPVKKTEGLGCPPLPHRSLVGFRGSPHPSLCLIHHLHGIRRPTFPCYAIFTQASISKINYYLIAMKTFTTLIHNSVAIHMTLLLNAVNSELFGWAVTGQSGHGLRSRL